MNAGKNCLVRIAMSLLMASSMAACSVDGDDGPDFGVDRIANTEDPDFDERLDSLGIVCETSLTLTGTYAAGLPRPGDVGGCWASGRWTVTPTVARQGCQPDLPFTAQLIYDVVRDEETSNDNVTFVADPNNERLNLKISSQGDGLCHGIFEHFLPDNIVLAINSTLEENGTITGTGTIAKYTDDPF